MKALILFTKTGAGHASAADALCESLKSLGVEVLKLDSLDYAGKSVSKNIGSTYVNIVRNRPEFFKLLYNAGEKISNPKIKSIIYVINAVYSNRIYEVIKSENPDLIICTHIFCAQSISHIKNKYGLTSLTAAIVTDYTCAPFWEETNLDYYFIPHKDLADEFISKGMDSNTLIPLGIPVDPKFNKHYSKKSAREYLNIDIDKSHILIMGGSMGAGKIFDTLAALSSSLPNANFTVVCGRNESLYQKFKDSVLNTNVHVIQFTNDIDKLMDASDILISKPGGLTSTEAMVKGIPLIMINPIPGVESENCKFFVSHDCAVYSESIDETVQLCSSLINNQSSLNTMISNQHKVINPMSAIDISKFLINKINDRRT